jgi:predicted DNA-binding transcriptional regulator YafY
MHDDDILSVLPDEAKDQDFISTPEVHRRLSARVISVPSVKTIGRWLDKLADDQFVDSRKRGTAMVWRKRIGASGLRSQATGQMGREEALALQTLKRFSSRQIPSLVADFLAPLFTLAEKRLEAAQTDSERRYRKWTEKVEVESGAFALHHPTIDAAIFSEVSRALFNEQKLEVVYRARSRGGVDATKIIDPLGLVEVGGLVYLVAGMQRHAKPAMYRLDRLASAAPLAEAADYPESFVLADYVQQQRQFDFMVEGEIHVVLRFFNHAGDHLVESPLAHDQAVLQSGDALQVSGTVLASQRLRWWLRSFGPNVEVRAPASLRAELAQEARALADMYAANAEGVSDQDTDCPKRALS